MLGEQDLEFVDCPECGFPAFVQHRFWVHSTHGDVSHLVTLCARLHRLCMEELPVLAPPEEAPLPEGAGLPAAVSPADADCFSVPATHEEPGARDAGTA